MQPVIEPPAMEGTMLMTSVSVRGVWSFCRKRISSSFTYTFTKLRSLPSSLKRCLRRSLYWAVSPASASPTVFASISTESFFPVYCLKGVGITTFTGIPFPRNIRPDLDLILYPKMPLLSFDEPEQPKDSPVQGQNAPGPPKGPMRSFHPPCLAQPRG